VLSIDTLSRSALRTYEAEAPELANLDRLAEASLVFERCASTSSWTLPAQASLLTGLYPDRHGARHPHLPIAPGAETVAAALEAAGYQTVAFTDGGFVDGSFGFARGFGRYDEEVADPELAGLELVRDGEPGGIPGASLFHRAAQFLEQRDPGQPFFLFLQTFAVHEYYRARPWTQPAWKGPPKPAEYYLECLTGKRKGTARDWRQLRALYNAELAHLDRGLGRLLATLEELGLAENTVVVLVSDHGEGLDPDRGRIHHGGRLTADLVRVPFLVRGPGIVAGRTETPVSLVDVAPTLLALAGLEVPPQLDGVSLASLLRGAPAEKPLAERPLYAQGYAFGWQGGTRYEVDEPPSEPITTAVLVGPYWYIRHGDGTEELYRRDLDPDQRTNLARSFEDIDDLRALAERRGAVQATGEALAPDPEVEARLRQLGY